MGNPGERRATYEDVLRAPRHLVAEVLHGVLYTQARPRTRHARSASRLGDVLGGPFDRGSGGPGGWLLLDEPEIHLGPEPDILVPDLAGWRRERMPELPDAAYLTLAPDWACEILSPSTEGIDRVEKIPLYAREGVGNIWLVDPGVRTLEVLRLDGSSYRIAVTVRGETAVRAEPFDAVELELGLLWAT